MMVEDAKALTDPSMAYLLLLVPVICLLVWGVFIPPPSLILVDCLPPTEETDLFAGMGGLYSTTISHIGGLSPTN